MIHPRVRRLRPHGDLRGDRRGFSLLEVMVALAVLATLLLGFGSAISAASTHRLVSNERRTAEQALSTYVETLRGLTLAEIVTEATTPTHRPAVDLRDAQWTLTVYDDEAGPGGAEGAALGFPIDLNADGDTDDANVPAGNLFLLPARVRLTWTCAVRSPMEVQLYVYFSNL